MSIFNGFSNIIAIHGGLGKVGKVCMNSAAQRCGLVSQARRQCYVIRLRRIVKNE